MKYKVWQNHPNEAFSFKNGECNFVSAWNDFLQSDKAKNVVPNYIIELQNLSQIEQFDNSSDELNEEDSPEIEKEDWMLVAEFLNAKSQHASEDDVVDKLFWEDQSMQFTEQQRQEMPNILHL